MSEEKTTTGDFHEVNRRYTMLEAINEAKRCLHCKVPMCRRGCPIENEIPDFIHQLSMGNLGVAMEIINEKSNLPAICGRVCPHEKQCEGHCVLARKGKAIHIGKIESFIADFDSDMNLIRQKLPQKTRGKVAVIGSGPAGLTVAGDLARQGFNVTIFDGQEEPGGVLMYGIPEYRLPKAVVRKEIAKIQALGVEFKLKCMIGVDTTVDKMFDEGFDAIFIGTGTALPQSLNLPGADLKGIVQSEYFLHCVNSYNEGAISRSAVPLKEGETVGIIGCGNVAMDAARTAIRMGAKSVTVVYRRTQAEMPANLNEYNEAVAEGVQFMWKHSPESFTGNEKGELQSIHVTTPDGEKDLPFDKIFLAVGSRPANRIVSTTKGIEVDDKGYVIVKDRPFGMTTRRGVFAGGDVVHRPQTVVLAMKAAKAVAVGIQQYVDAIKLLEDCKKDEENLTENVMIQK